MSSVFASRTEEELLEGIDARSLAKLRTWIQIERYHSARRVSSLKEVRKFIRRMQDSKEKVVADLKWFGFTLEQMKVALLLSDDYCVPNGNEAQQVLQEWQYPLSKGAGHSSFHSGA